MFEKFILILSTYIELNYGIVDWSYCFTQHFFLNIYLFDYIFFN